MARGDRSVYEMKVNSSTLDALGCIDQLNLPNLKGAELLARRYQLIKEAHLLSATSPDYSAADIFMGWSSSRGGVASTLQNYASEELRKRAAMHKEARKAREEQNARNQRGRGRGKGAKGGGRGAPAAAEDG